MRDLLIVSLLSAVLVSVMVTACRPRATCPIPAPSAMLGAALYPAALAEKGSRL